MDTVAADAVERALARWAEDPQAVANLLLHPSLLPEPRMTHLRRGLNELRHRYYILASCVGLLGVKDLPPDILQRLRELAMGAFGLVCAHAFIALEDHLAEADVGFVTRLVDHKDPTVQHNALAWLLRRVGPAGSAEAELKRIESSGLLSQERLEEVKGVFARFGREAANVWPPSCVVALAAYVPSLTDISEMDDEFIRRPFSR
jgi:hypothetical protein